MGAMRKFRETEREREEQKHKAARKTSSSHVMCDGPYRNSFSTTVVLLRRFKLTTKLLQNRIEPLNNVIYRNKLGSCTATRRQLRHRVA